MATLLQYNLIDPTIHAAVEADHVARQAAYLATYDDGTTAQINQMLYWGGTRVQSASLVDWPVIEVAVNARIADAAALRQRVRTVAQSAVGVQFDQLTAAQLRALLAILLWKQDALDSTGAVRPLADWVR